MFNSFANSQDLKKVYFAGGCFWCTEAIFKYVSGVEDVVPGYVGGTTQNPTYEEVCTGKTGHAEIVEVIFDPDIISFETILQVFFTVHDPTQLNRQGNDIGTQYRSCIMPTSDTQEQISKKVIKEMQQFFNSEIVTTIEQPTNFTIAEKYHHDYYARNPYQGYCMAVVGPKLSKLRKKLAHLY